MNYKKNPGRCFVRIVVVFHCSWCLFHLLRSKGIIHYAKLGKVVKGTIFLLFAKRTPLPLMLVQPKICLVAPADLKHHVDGSHSINKPTYFDTLPRELFAKVCFHYFLFGFFFFFLSFPTPLKVSVYYEYSIYPSTPEWVAPKRYSG